MKKLFFYMPFVLASLVALAWTVLCFVLCPILLVDGVLGTWGFWMAFIFTVPLGMGLLFWITNYTLKDEGTRIVAIKYLRKLYFIIPLVYLPVFPIFGCLLTDFPLAAISIGYGVVATIVMIIVIIKMMGHIMFLRSTTKAHHQAVENKRNTLIPNLLNEVNISASVCDDANVKLKLANLSALLANSPQISHVSLEDLERDIQVAVKQITTYVRLKSYDEVDGFINDATFKLMERNTKCNALPKN